jgi:hypothetical protein
MRYNVLVGVDSLFQGTSPGYNDKQMSAILNKAQRRVFGMKAPLFDTNEKIKKTLSPLIRRASTATGGVIAVVDAAILAVKHDTTLFTGKFYRLPADVGYVVEEYAILELATVHTDPIIVLPITYDYFLKNYTNRYKKPSTSLLWRLDYKQELVTATLYYTSEIIYPKTHTLDTYSISYLKYPADIDVDTTTPASQVSCELPDQSFQDEVVGEAIKIITAALNDEGYQVAAAEKKFDEN